MTCTQTQLQEVDVVSYAQQHSLPALRLGRTSRSLRRQLPLHRREDALDLSALAVPLSWEAPAHLRPDTLDLPVRLASLGWDNTVSAERISNVKVVALAIKLGICEHRPDRRHTLGGAHQWAQSRAVVVRPLPGRLRQYAPTQNIDDYCPLAPVPPLQALAAVGAAVDKEGADGAGREPGRIYSDDRLLPLAASAARGE